MRNPDGTLNQAIVQAQGMSSEMFVAQLRQEIGMQQVLRGVSQSGMAPAAVAGSALDALFQRRSIAMQRFDAKTYAAKVMPTDAELEAYHKAHESEFSAPEQATIEYVVLDLDTLKKGITLGDKDLRDYYEQNKARYTAAEERRARHILIAADKDAKDDAKKKAKARAEALAGRGAQGAGIVRRAGEEELRRQRLRAARRRSRLVRARWHGGQGAGGRGVRVEARRNRTGGRDRVRLPRGQARRHARRPDQAVRCGEAPRSPTR